MKTNAWQRSLGTLSGFPILILAVLTIYQGTSPWWLLASFLIYNVIGIAISTGYHRLFSHRTYTTSKAWEWILAIIGCASLNSSPAHWSIVHLAHHKHADTPQDPHDVTWRYFFRFKNRDNLRAPATVIRMLRDPMHRRLSDYSFAIFLAAALASAAFGYNAFLFLFALPVSAYLLAAGAHTIYAHEHRAPKNYPAMEYLMPLGGEWLHKLHHDKPGLYTWNGPKHFFDIGGYFIKFIRKQST